MKHQNHHYRTVLALAVAVTGIFWLCSGQPAWALSAPTVVSPKNNYVLPPDTKLAIIGLVQNDSSVFFIIDGKLAGGVVAKNGKKGTASFSFKSKQIYGVGVHTIQVQARRKGVTSSFTDKLTFTVPKVWPRRLDGLLVPAAQANAVPVGVMIENLAQVRPQSGLAAASVVYEALAEGGIPRFLAIFARDDMAKVGPVRSARPYYVDWAKEYRAPVLHAGGSRDAFKEFGRLAVRSIDALVSKTARYFYRAGKWETTHNLFTSGALLKKVKQTFEINKAPATYTPWKFKNDPLLVKRPKEKRQLVIDFKSGKQYIVAYRYDRQSNSYLRFNGGQPHLDANYPQKTQIKVKNVVVQLIEKERVLDWQKHLELQITGRGRGWLLQDGKLQPITWKKPNPASRTTFYYLNKKEVEFTRGNTWIEVVPQNRPVLWQ